MRLSVTQDIDIKLFFYHKIQVLFMKDNKFFIQKIVVIVYD